jgi:hypothetical protein
MDLTNVSGPADLVTRAFFRMENAMQLGTSATVAMAGAMYVFNDFKKYRAYVDDLTKSIEAMQKQFDRRNMSSVEREVLGLSDKQGELGNRVGGVGAAAQNVYAASPFNAIAGFIGDKSGGDYRMKSTVEEAVEIYKEIERVKKNIAQIDQENRDKEKAADAAKMAAAANQVKIAYEKLAIEKGMGPIAAYIFEQKQKILEAEKSGNTELAKTLQKLADYNVRLMGNAAAEKRMQELRDKDAENAKNRELEDARIRQEDADAMGLSLGSEAAPDAATSLGVSRGSIISDSLARVGGGGGVFSSGPQQSFNKISSNTDTLVTIVKGISEKIGAGATTYA